MATYFPNLKSVLGFLKVGVGSVVVEVIVVFEVVEVSVVSFFVEDVVICAVLSLEVVLTLLSASVPQAERHMTSAKQINMINDFFIILLPLFKAYIIVSKVIISYFISKVNLAI